MAIIKLKQAASSAGMTDLALVLGTAPTSERLLKSPIAIQSGPKYDALAPRPEMTDNERKWFLWEESGRADRSEPMSLHLRGIDYLIYPQHGQSIIVPEPHIVPLDWIDPELGTSDDRFVYNRRPKPSFRKQITFSQRFAQDYGVSDAIVYRHLQLRQIENKSEGAFHRFNKVWVADGAKQIFEQALPIFGDRQTVLDAIHRLHKHGHVEFGDPDLMVPENERTGRKQDARLWCHAPERPDSTEVQVALDLMDAKLHGIPQAILIHRIMNAASPTPSKIHDGELYTRGNATEWAKKLPMSDRTIRTALDELVERQVIAAHPKHPKYYRVVNRNSGVGKTLEEAREFIPWKRAFFVRN